MAGEVTTAMMLARIQGVGGGGSALIAAGATFGFVSDGLNAPNGGVGGGTPNPMHQLMRLIGHRIQEVPLPNLGVSGTTIGRDISTNRAWINPYAINALKAQVPDIWIHGPMGANDNLLSTDPGASPGDGLTTNVYLQDWYDAAKAAHTAFAAYGGKLFLVPLTPASTKVGESTYRTTVWNAQKAFIASLTATDSKVKLVDNSDMSDATLWSNDTGSSYTHFDERGGYAFAYHIFQVLDPLITALTADQFVDMLDAGTYPLMSGVNLDADEVLTGTGGTVTGPGVTGSIATSKAISNTTGATGITVAQVATSSGRTKTVVTLAGTTTGAGKVLVQDKSSISLSGTPGQPFRTGAIFRISAGFHNFGSEWNNNAGGWGGGATSLIANGRVGAAETHALDALIINGAVIGSNGTLNFNSSTSFAGKRSYAAFFNSGTDLTGKIIEFERPFAYKISNRLAAAPAYIGDVANSVGALFLGNNYRLRPTGSVSQAAGGAIRVEPGQWNLFGLSEADFAARRIYKGTSGNTGVGTGTLIGTLSGSTWTKTFIANDVTTGDLIYVEVDCNNGVGGTVTARSAITVTAT